MGTAPATKPADTDPKTKTKPKTPAAPPTRTRPKWAVWSSPADQPAWARPALLGLAAVAAFIYAWKMHSAELEPYYAAGVRSMSQSWHNFLYGAFDPAGTITLDKLPGAFWIQALSVKIFGVHTWALVLPQVIEGVLTVLVLYRVVRRLAGARAGIVAALVLVASPANVTLNRGNISDTLMVLLLVLAADATVSAIQDDRPNLLLLAGLCVGFAFQAKMLQAWLAIPGLGLAYLVAGPGKAKRRVSWLAAAGAVVAVTSLVWMVFVSITPKGSRPYVDGSHHNSIWEQVFDYNGFGRLAEQSPVAVLSNQAFGRKPPTQAAGWNRLLSGANGRASGWLIPAALVALVALAVLARKRRRDDPLVAGLLLWGGWLVLLLLAFSVASSVNPYYTAALSPAIGALIGMGLVVAWDSSKGRALAAATVLLTAGYGAILLANSGSSAPGWLFALLLVVGIGATVVLALTYLPEFGSGRVLTGAIVAGVVGLLFAPGLASASVVVRHQGPFDTPFQPASTTSFNRQLFVEVPRSMRELLPQLNASRGGAPYLLATQTSWLASPFIFASGEEALPIGGFTGTIPVPTLATLQRFIRDGRFHLVVTAKGDDPRIVWIREHCLDLAKASGGESSSDLLKAYYCVPAIPKP